MTTVELIEREEGLVLHAYQDHLGYWTIGFGRLIDKRKGGGISEEEARYLLKNDIKNIESSLDEKVPWWRDLNGPRRAVLTSMAFQLGIKGLLGFEKTLAAIKRGDYSKGAAGMRASLWARQTPGRAERHAKIMESGRFS